MMETLTAREEEGSERHPESSSTADRDGEDSSEGTPPNGRRALSDRLSVIDEEDRQHGADLLLSLAETASKHAEKELQFSAQRDQLPQSTGEYDTTRMMMKTTILAGNEYTTSPISIRGSPSAPISTSRGMAPSAVEDGVDGTASEMSTTPPRHQQRLLMSSASSAITRSGSSHPNPSPIRPIGTLYGTPDEPVLTSASTKNTDGHNDFSSRLQQRPMWSPTYYYGRTPRGGGSDVLREELPQEESSSSLLPKHDEDRTQSPSLGIRRKRPSTDIDCNLVTSPSKQARIGSGNSIEVATSPLKKSSTTNTSTDNVIISPSSSNDRHEDSDDQVSNNSAATTSSGNEKLSDDEAAAAALASGFHAGAVQPHQQPTAPPHLQRLQYPHVLQQPYLHHAPSQQPRQGGAYLLRGGGPPFPPGYMYSHPPPYVSPSGTVVGPAAAAAAAARPYGYSPHSAPCRGPYGPGMPYYGGPNMYGGSGAGMRPPIRLPPYATAQQQHHQMQQQPYSVLPSPMYSNASAAMQQQRSSTNSGAVVQPSPPSSSSTRSPTSTPCNVTSFSGHGASASNSPTSAKPSKESAPASKDESIDWGRVASSAAETLSSIAGGSNQRCIQLKNPVACRSLWNTGKEYENLKIPDFLRLVNFPDFLARGRTRPDPPHSGGVCGNSTDGKKNCVMCGKLRICSASGGMMNSSSSGNVASKKFPKDSNSHINDDDDESESTHIIPRQNKGVCTACDVTVWVIVDNNLEIKWCKGCKNFRPWVSFGEKGMATKCVRCRNRQKEKYATQKKESSNSVVSTRHPQRAVWEEKKDDEGHDVVNKRQLQNRDDDDDAIALRGLQHLRQAAGIQLVKD